MAALRHSIETHFEHIENTPCENLRAVFTHFIAFATPDGTLIQDIKFDTAYFYAYNYQEANSKMLDLDYIKQNLNENEIKLIRLRFEEELNFEEIAQILNSSSQNIRKALSRLTQKIKKTVQSG